MDITAGCERLSLQAAVARTDMCVAGECTCTAAECTLHSTCSRLGLASQVSSHCNTLLAAARVNAYMAGLQGDVDEAKVEALKREADAVMGDK